MSTGTWTIGRSVFFTGVALAAAILVDQIVGCMSAPAQVSQRWPIVTAAAITAPPLPPATPLLFETPDDLIVQMARSAGVIFVGRVLEIRRRQSGYSGSPEAAAEGVVEVDFVVDQAVRGPAQASVYTLREWGGLWTGETGRYRVGQRLLVLLHAPDVSGLSSPVHGAEGLIPLRGGGPPPGPDDGLTSASQSMVDVRWLQTQTLRNQESLGLPGRGPIPIRGGPRSELSGVQSQGEVPLLVRANRGPWVEPEPLVAQAEPLSHILALCASSTGSDDAAK